jgi:hypothetical protein
MGIFGKLRGGASYGRGDDPHGVTSTTQTPFGPETTRSTGQNTRYNETTGRNEIGLRREGPSSFKSSVTNRVYIGLHDRGDGGKVWIDEKSPAGKAQAKSDKSTAKALKNVNKPKTIAKSAKAGQAYDAAKAADDRVNDSWLKPGGMEYMGSDQETADKKTVKTMKTGGVDAVAKQVKKNPSMQKDAQDVRTKRIMDEKR